jgi:hypothetical protein
MRALETVNKKETAPTYNRIKSVQDSVGHKHEVGPDFVGSGYYPPERFIPLLAKFSHPANMTHRTQLFAQLQGHYWNRAEEAESKLASEIISKRSSGRALEPDVREFMELRGCPTNQSHNSIVHKDT